MPAGPDIELRHSFHEIIPLESSPESKSFHTEGLVKQLPCFQANSAILIQTPQNKPWYENVF